MTKHYNPTIVERANQIFNTKTGDHVGAEVSPIIAPTIELRKQIDIAREADANDATSATIFTTPAAKDFYLTSAVLSVAKGALNNASSANISITIQGFVQNILRMALTAATAGQGLNMQISFPYPGIKCDRGTNVTVGASEATATIKSAGSITGYIVETLKGGQ